MKSSLLHTPQIAAPLPNIQPFEEAPPSRSIDEPSHPVISIEQLQSRKPVTFTLQQISGSGGERRISNAIYAVFNKPERFLSELIANAHDSMRRPEEQIGRFGMGFFSCLQALNFPEGSGSDLRVETTFREPETKEIISYSMTFRKGGDDIEVSFQGCAPREYTGTKIIIGCRGDEEYSDSYLTRLRRESYRFHFIPDQRAAISLSIEKRRIVVEDRGCGISLATAWNKLLSPSASDKGEGAAVEKTSADITLEHYPGKEDVTKSYFVAVVRGVVAMATPLKELIGRDKEGRELDVILFFNEAPLLFDRSVILITAAIREAIKSLFLRLLQETSHAVNRQQIRQCLRGLSLALAVWDNICPSERKRGGLQKMIFEEFYKLLDEPYIIPVPEEQAATFLSIFGRDDSYRVLPLPDMLFRKAKGYLRSRLEEYGDAQIEEMEAGVKRDFCEKAFNKQLVVATRLIPCRGLDRKCYNPAVTGLSDLLLFSSDELDDLVGEGGAKEERMVLTRVIDRISPFDGHFQIERSEKTSDSVLKEFEESQWNIGIPNYTPFADTLWIIHYISSAENLYTLLTEHALPLVKWGSQFDEESQKRFLNGEKIHPTYDDILEGMFQRYESILSTTLKKISPHNPVAIKFEFWNLTKGSFAEYCDKFLSSLGKGSSQDKQQKAFAKLFYGTFKDEEGELLGLRDEAIRELTKVLSLQRLESMSQEDLCRAMREKIEELSCEKQLFTKRAFRPRHIHLLFLYCMAMNYGFIEYLHSLTLLPARELEDSITTAQRLTIRNLPFINGIDTTLSLPTGVMDRINSSLDHFELHFLVHLFALFPELHKLFRDKWSLSAGGEAVEPHPSPTFPLFMQKEKLLFTSKKTPLYHQEITKLAHHKASQMRAGLANISGESFANILIGAMELFTLVEVFSSDLSPSCASAVAELRDCYMDFYEQQFNPRELAARIRQTTSLQAPKWGVYIIPNQGTIQQASEKINSIFSDGEMSKKILALQKESLAEQLKWVQKAQLHPPSESQKELGGSLNHVIVSPLNTGPFAMLLALYDYLEMRLTKSIVEVSKTATECLTICLTLQSFAGMDLPNFVKDFDESTCILLQKVISAIAKSSQIRQEIEGFWELHYTKHPIIKADLWRKTNTFKSLSQILLAQIEPKHLLLEEEAVAEQYRSRLEAAPSCRLSDHLARIEEAPIEDCQRRIQQAVMGSERLAEEAMIIESLQNSYDAACRTGSLPEHYFTLGIVRSQNSSASSMEEEWGGTVSLRMRDCSGMSRQTIERAFLVPGSSTKELEPGENMGRFGRGVFEYYRESSRVTLLSSADGETATLLSLIPIREIGGNVSDIQMRITDLNISGFKGTEITIYKNCAKDEEIKKVFASWNISINALLGGVKLPLPSGELFNVYLKSGNQPLATLSSDETSLPLKSPSPLVEVRRGNREGEISQVRIGGLPFISFTKLEQQQGWNLPDFVTERLKVGFIFSLPRTIKTTMSRTRLQISNEESEGMRLAFLEFFYNYTLLDAIDQGHLDRVIRHTSQTRNIDQFVSLEGREEVEIETTSFATFMLYFRPSWLPATTPNIISAIKKQLTGAEAGEKGLYERYLEQKKLSLEKEKELVEQLSIDGEGDGNKALIAAIKENRRFFSDEIEKLLRQSLDAAPLKPSGEEPTPFTYEWTHQHVVRTWLLNKTDMRELSRCSIEDLLYSYEVAPGNARRKSQEILEKELEKILYSLNMKEIDELSAIKDGFQRWMMCYIDLMKASPLSPSLMYNYESGTSNFFAFYNYKTHSITFNLHSFKPAEMVNFVACIMDNRPYSDSPLFQRIAQIGLGDAGTINHELLHLRQGAAHKDGPHGEVEMANGVILPFEEAASAFVEEILPTGFLSIARESVKSLLAETKYEEIDFHNKLFSFFQHAQSSDPRWCWEKLGFLNRRDIL